MKRLNLATNDMMRLLNVMDRAGFTGRELNNDRLRLAALSVIEQTEMKFRAAGVWHGQTFKTYRDESLDQKTMYLKD